MKNRSINMLIVALILIAAFAVVLIFFIENAHQKFEGGITVKADGVTESIIPVRDLQLNPTDQKQYEINLVCEASGDYYVSLDFEQTENGGMNPYVNVAVKSDGTEVFSGKLTELLDDDKIIQFEGRLYATEPLVITVIYEMPETVGNEAQGTYTDFDIHLEIVKK